MWKVDRLFDWSFMPLFTASSMPGFLGAWSFMPGLRDFMPRGSCRGSRSSWRESCVGIRRSRSRVCRAGVGPARVWAELPQGAGPNLWVR